MTLIPDILSMQIGSRYVVTVDFGEAYAALVRGRTKNAPTMHREVVFVPCELHLRGETYPGDGGAIIVGEVSWERFRCPGRLQVLFQPRRNEPEGPVVRVGENADRGGFADGSWIIGQFGPVVRVVATERPAECSGVARTSEVLS